MAAGPVKAMQFSAVRSIWFRLGVTRTTSLLSRVKRASSATRHTLRKS